MKNKGCWIAGCAGAAMLTVVLMVICVAVGFYLYKQGRASEVPAAPMAEMPPLPSSVNLTDADKVEMVLHTLQGFQAGIRAGTFRGFYGRYFSDLWKSRFTAEQFDKVFATFLSARVELDPSAFHREPVFTKDSRDPDGVVHFAGSYLVRNANGGEEVKWELDYLHEDRGWGLTFINIHAVPVSTLR